MGGSGVQAARLSLRMQRELQMLHSDPPPGVSLRLPDQSSASNSLLSVIDAQMEGPQGSAYIEGLFHIRIQIPDRYPLHPPIVTFMTPIYHPNIDEGGRICLDILNLPPKGAWQPSLNISTVLMSIGLLLSEPNPDDGLVHEASREYKYNRQAFDQKARFWTEKYAKATIICGVAESIGPLISIPPPPVVQSGMEETAVEAMRVSRVGNNKKPYKSQYSKIVLGGQEGTTNVRPTENELSTSSIRGAEKQLVESSKDSTQEAKQVGARSDVEPRIQNVQEPSSLISINRNGEESSATGRGYRRQRLSLPISKNNVGSSVKHDQQEQTQKNEHKENQGLGGDSPKLSLSLPKREGDCAIKHSQQKQAQAGQFNANQMQEVLNHGKVEVPTKKGDITGAFQLVDSNVRDGKGEQICSMIIVSDSESDEEENIRPPAKLRLSLNRSRPR